ncbi:hypothetical protein F2P81_012260 [Scophthalmus maximus]|uniref:Uncharacterized protein n=1 Tax=Scophthalmus maximus TaxID=52904 RepID=A0A6A4SWQ5_SCOMX|nr:hypothetical protein F2P81_012260 [Scophthalmus maximus]
MMTLWPPVILDFDITVTVVDNLTIWFRLVTMALKCFPHERSDYMGYHGYQPIQVIVGWELTLSYET